MTQVQESTCTAPLCPKPAIWVARGIDFDGTKFIEYVCDGCGSYLLECGATLKSIATGRDYWEIAGDAA